MTLGRQITEQLHDNRSPKLARALLQQIPEQSLGLDELAAEAEDILLKVLAPSAQNEPAMQAEVAGLQNNRGVHLAVLGQREPALEAANEAVAIRRKLAEERPDAFLPDLATSLGAMGMTHLQADDSDSAAECFVEGLQRITPLFLAIPQAYAELTGKLARAYLQACEAAEQEPDQKLLQPVVEVFERLQRESEET